MTTALELPFPPVVGCQRWRDRRSSLRRPGEVIDPRAFAVDEIEEAPAKRFVVQHHYSGSYPAALARVGLYRGRDLVGVAVFAEPAQPRTLSRWAPAAPNGAVLSRFVLVDDVAANGETWFLARAFRIIRQRFAAIVSYSDPERRFTDDGRIVLPGHVGTIYQAFNGRYLGRSSSETLVLDRDGRVVSRRALSKIRGDERGAAYAYRTLLAAGAPPRRLNEDGAAYVARALAEGPFRRVRHPGNHVYVWGDLTVEGQPYPKRDAR